jgi:hypothetical protein
MLDILKSVNVTGNKVGIMVLGEVKIAGSNVNMGPTTEDLTNAGCTINFNLFTRVDTEQCRDNPWDCAYEPLISNSNSSSSSSSRRQLKMSNGRGFIDTVDTHVSLPAALNVHTKST